MNRAGAPNATIAKATARNASLWTCNRCNRNNEAKCDSCRHCRSPRAGARVGGSSFDKVPGQVRSAGNSSTGYIQQNNSRNSGDGSSATGGGWGGARPAGRIGMVAQLQDLAEMDSRNLRDYEVEQNFAGSCRDRLIPEPYGRDERCNVSSSRGTGGGSFRTGGSGVLGRPTPSRYSPPPNQQQPPLPRVPIDIEAAETWIYPVNYPVRQYQLQIVTEALYKNTLVALPTGLGKTLIAAVVMYNFYRWFPSGKVVFLAPTKPLVAQQISACYDIMGLPEVDTAELQGSVTPETRRKLWDERRVFYCTPQSMANDIRHKRCDPARFVCVVVDEAHRGTGNYAYVNVIREVAAATSHFRVLALSATPGSDIKSIQQVLMNLRISHIECRGEDDPEVSRHTHARQVEVVKCKLGNHIDAIRQGLVAVLQPLVSRMVDRRVLYTRDPMALKAWTVIQCLHTFRRTAQEKGQTHMAGEVESEMGILTKVVQAKDTLVTHGAAGCLQKLSGMEYEVKRRGFRSNAERRVIQHPEWGGLMTLLRQTAENVSGLSVKHPKLIKLKEILREHFTRHQAGGKSTRAIVFTHLRDSVEEITEFLGGEELLRVKAFIGQGNGSGAKAQAAAAAAQAAASGKELQGDRDWDDEEEPMAAPKQRLKGQTQKEQKAVVKAFFSGEFNCLVATCIAEEGLDIGEVDLIVSFDALNSPVRMVQRMGRTGRKRAGKVVVLVTEGNEESKLKNSNSKSKSITKALQTKKDKFDLFQGDDPMVPPGPRPRMVKQEMVIVEYHLSQVGGHQSKRKPAKKSAGGTRGGRRSTAGRGSGGGSGSSDNSNDWRLTPTQKATLAEEYMEEPGTKLYVPHAAIGWRNQKNRWAAGSVARSARSKVLCGVKDFVQHQEWELLYDPSDMQFIMANRRNEDDGSSNNEQDDANNTNTPPGRSGGSNEGSGRPFSVNAVNLSSDSTVFDEYKGAVKRGGGGSGGGTVDGSVSVTQQAPESMSPWDGGGGGSRSHGRGDGGSPAIVDLALDSDEDAVFEARASERSKPRVAKRKGFSGKGRNEGREGKMGDVGKPVTTLENRYCPDVPGKRKRSTACSKFERKPEERMDQGGQVIDCDVVGKVRSAGVYTTANVAGLSMTALSVEGEPHTAQEMERREGGKVGAAETPTTNKDNEELAQGSDEDARTRMYDESAQAFTNGDVDADDDDETQSDPECAHRCRRRRPSGTAPGSGARSSDANDHVLGAASSEDNSCSSSSIIACNQSSDGTVTRAGVAAGYSTHAAAGAAASRSKERDRWRCGCGCVVNAGRRNCSMCGGTATAAAAATMSYCLHGKRGSPPLDRHVDRVHERSSLSCPPTIDTLSASISLSGSDRAAAGGGGGESLAVCTGTSASSNDKSNCQARRRCPSEPPASKQTKGRWQCDCGCSMKARSKRCAMCGQSRPPGHTDTSVARPSSVDNDGEDGNSSGSSSCSGGGGDCSTVATTNGSTGGGSEATVGRGGGSLKGPTLGAATPSAKVSPSAGAGGGCTVLTPAAAALGGDGETWRCSGCGNEYNAARLKCRACKTPKPGAVTGTFSVGGTDSQNAVHNSSNKRVQQVGNDFNAENCSRTKGGEVSLLTHKCNNPKMKSQSGRGEDVGTGNVAGEPSPEPASPSIREDRLTQDCDVDDQKGPIAFGVRDLSTSVADGPASPVVDRTPRQPSLGTSTPTARRRVAAASPPRSIQHYKSRLGLGIIPGINIAVACAAGAEESPAAGSTFKVLNGPEPNALPATEDSQDHDSLAGLFPSLHQFEAEQESCDIGEGDGNAFLQGYGVAMTTGRSRSTGGINRFAGGWSPLIGSSPSSLSSRPPSLSTTTVRSVLPTPTGALLLPPPPVLSYVPTSATSVSQERSSPSSCTTGSVDAAVLPAATITTASAFSATADVPADCKSQIAAPTRTLGFSCSGDPPAHWEDSGSRGTVFPEQVRNEGDRIQDSENDDEWEQDAQGDTECEDYGSPACGNEPSPSDGDETPRCANAEAEEAARGIVEEFTAEMLTGPRGGERLGCGPGDRPETEEITAGSVTGNRSNNREGKSSMRDKPREREDCNVTQGGGSDLGSSTGGGGGGGDGDGDGDGGEGNSQSSGGDLTGGGCDRTSPEEDCEDDDVCCGVCGSATSKEDDPIVLCDGENCTTAVHADCYGVMEVPEGPWLCEPCACSQQLLRGSPSSPTGTVVETVTTEGKKHCHSSPGCQKSASALTTCDLCSRSGGALKLSQCGKWAHVVCVWWTPELTSDPDTVRPGPLSTLDPERGSLACSRCHERGGAAVQCAIPSCLEACHPFCALRAGLLLREDQGVFEMFCRTHSRRERQKERHENFPAAAASGGDGDFGCDAFAATREGHAPAREEDSGSSRDAWVGGEWRKSKESGKSGARVTGTELKSVQSPPPMPSPESIELFACSQSQVKPRLASGCSGARRQWPGKQSLLSDSDDDDEGSEHGSRSGAGTGVGRGSLPEASASDEKGTPLKVFDMAPPAAASATKLVRGGRSESTACVSPHDGGGGAGDDDLVTLSQAVSPVDNVRKDVKRRRLKKSAAAERPSLDQKRLLGGRAERVFSRERGQEQQKTRPKAAEVMMTAGQKGGSGATSRRCEFDKASYRRYIDHEAEVDEDVSDDDEAGLDDYYDSEDSFVDDGPMSYETCSSQEDGVDTPSSLRDSQCDDGDVEEDDDGDNCRRGKGKGTKKKRRFEEEENEKGMYLQLLAQSQTPRRPGRTASPARNRNRGRSLNGAGRGGSRCAFINAVMSHARDGGDPLDIENACDSDVYPESSQTPTTQTTPTTAAVTTACSRRSNPQPSPGEEGTGTMSSGGSSGPGRLPAEEQALADPMYSDGEDEAAEEPLYSQAMRQTYSPGSPSPSPSLRKAMGMAAEACAVPSSSVPAAKRARIQAEGDKDAAAGGDKENLRPAHDRISLVAGSVQANGSGVCGGGGGFMKGAANNGGEQRLQAQSSQRAALRSVAQQSGQQQTTKGNQSATATTVSAAGVAAWQGALPGRGHVSAANSSISTLASRGSNSGTLCLTEEQRKKMQENRAKALERLRQKQTLKAGWTSGGSDGGLSGGGNIRHTTPVCGFAQSQSDAAPDLNRLGGDGNLGGGGSLSQANTDGLTQSQSDTAPAPRGLSGDVARDNTSHMRGKEAPRVLAPPSSKLSLKRPRLSLSSRNTTASNRAPVSRLQQSRSDGGVAAAPTMAGITPQQRGKFRVNIDMDDDDDSDGDGENANVSPGTGNARALRTVKVSTIMQVEKNSNRHVAGATGQSTGTTSMAAKSNEQRRRPTSPEAAPATGSSASTAGTTVALSASQNRPAPRSPFPPRPSLTAAAAVISSTKATASSVAAVPLTFTATVPLSAPRASALEALARELRSRPGLILHACPLGGGAVGSIGSPLLRDVDLVVGAQCAVCVRSRRQFVSQVLGRKNATLPCPSWPPSGSSQASSADGAPSREGGLTSMTVASSSQQQQQQSSRGPAAANVGNCSVGVAGGSSGVAVSPQKTPPLLTLLQANLVRYARVVVIVEGLEDEQNHGGGVDRSSGGGGSQGEEVQTAISMVTAMRGVSVVASRGWRDTADKVVGLIAGEERAGLGLPREVAGPSISAAQTKFLSLLLRAPTLSYPGGLFLLQAFRGRSVKEVIGSAAQDFQTAVPGMTAQQAAKLKRFLVSAGSSPRRQNNKKTNSSNNGGSNVGAGLIKH